MNSHRLTGLLTTAAVLLLAWPGLAPAQEGEAPAESRPQIYTEYRGGASILQNQNLTGADATGSGLSGSMRPETGWTIGGALGTQITDLFRVELGIDYRRGDVDSVGVGVNADKDASGDLSLLTIMTNVYVEYDFDIGVIPFLGAGIGWGLYDLDAESKQVQMDDSDSVFAYNFMVGGSYSFTEVTDFTLGYRYVGTEDPDIKSRVQTVPANRRLDTEFDSHEVYMGVRFRF